MSFAVLMYHEIRKGSEFDPSHASHIDVKQGYDDILPPPLFVTLEHFEEQMAYLHEHGYKTLTLDEVKGFYYSQSPLPERSVLLTFDDCYQSIKLYAYPILKKYGFRATAFVVTNWLHDMSKAYDPLKSICMTEQDLHEMTDVFEYANHTDSLHTRTSEATSAMMIASDEQIINDLNVCNASEIINAKDVFAYTFGLFCERNVTLLRQLGYKLAFTSDGGLNDSSTDPLLLRRDAIPYFIELDDFKKIVGHY